METQQRLCITEPEASPCSIHINGKCNYRDEGDLRVIFAHGIPFFHYAVADKAADRYAMIHLVETGLASQEEIVAAFACSRPTLFRARRSYSESGMAGLVPKKTGPKQGTKINKAMERRLVQLKKKGLSNDAIGCRLGVKGDTVRKALKRVGWCEPKACQENLALEPSEDGGGAREKGDVEAAYESGKGLAESGAEAGEAEQVSNDRNPSDRCVDRAMARLGLLQDAAPLFQNATNVSRAGVLLAIPAVVESGIFHVAKEVYGSLGASFYGLRTTVLMLLLMALLRIKYPESLKEYSAVELGRLLGLDRALEMKTLRRKLDCLACRKKAVIFGRQLSTIRVQRRQGSVGFLYADGHVRVYNGKRKLAKAYVTKRRLAMPATTDYWVNDQEGDPVFVVTAPANEGLAKMLPVLLAEARSVIGDQRPLTVVFDRGGWSPKLFLKLMDQGFDVITYRKGKVEPISPECFCLLSEQIEGKRIEYWLHESSVGFLDGKLSLRQITRLNPSGHQTHIVTSRQDLSAVTIAYRMFERWRQENFFKYMTEEYALDALIDYDVEEDDLERLVPNPRRKEINLERKQVKAEIKETERSYGLEAIHNEESRRRTMRGFKIANSNLTKKIENLEQREVELKAVYKQTPAKIPLKYRFDTEETLYRLKREKKHLSDVFKMVAYQAETDLLALIRPHYARADDEGRTLIQTAFMSSGDTEVTETELRIKLNPLSSPHRSKAIKVLCARLNAMRTVFPGSKLRLVYDVKDQDDVSQNPGVCQEF